MKNPNKCNVSLWNENLGKCRSKLLGWNRRKYPRCDKELIKECLFDLEALQCANPFDSIEEQERLSSKLGDLWIKEEQYWHQRSRIHWLTAGDSNTRFFHLSTLHRRQ